MADPFDIYRTGAMGAEPAPVMFGSAHPDAVQATEAARQRALLGMKVREMMGAGATPQPVTAAGKSVAADMAAGAGTATAEAPGMVGRTMARIGGFGMKGAGRAWLAAAPVLGAAKSIADSPEEVKANADQQGFDYNSFGGRVGANAVNFLKNTGDAATFGMAGAMGRGISNVMGGQSFFDPVGGAKPLPAAAPTNTNTAMDREDANDFAPNPGFGAVANAPAAPALAPVVPFTASDVRGNRVPASGTGAFVNNSTGAVTNFDTRVAPGPGANPNRVEASSGDSPLAMFYGAGMNMKRAAQIASGEAAKYKVDAEYGAGSDKQATAAKNRAETASIMERQRLAAAEPDPTRRAAILAGHTPPVDQHVFLPTMDANKVDVGTKATGAVQRVTVQPKLTEENIQASMKGQKMSREQVLAAYKTKGYDVSGMR